MFEENSKFADEYLRCKDIKDIREENGKKVYTFNDGTEIKLDADLKIYSDIINNKLIVEKDGKYGFITLDNSVFNYDPEKEGYRIVRPIFDKVELYNEYTYAEVSNEIHLFDVFGSEVVIEKEEDFIRINNNTIFNNGYIYDISSHPFTRSDYEKEYHISVSDKSEAKVKVYPSTGNIIVIIKGLIFSKYDKDGNIIINNKYIAINNHRGYLSFTSNENILKVSDVENNKFFKYYNITNDICSKSYRGVSTDYVKNHCFVNENESSYMMDENFNITNLNFTIAVPNFEHEEYLPIYIEKMTASKRIKDALYVLDIGDGRDWEKPVKQYGYCNSNGEIVVDCNYNTIEEARKHLEKYVVKKEKKDTKALKKQEKENSKKQINVEEIKPLNKKTEVEQLEEDIMNYLFQMKIQELEDNFRMLKRNYSIKIEEAAKKDVERRRNVVSGTLMLGSNESSDDLLKEYIYSLKTFKGKLENNIHIVNILDKINTLNKVAKGEKVQTNDELIKLVEELISLYPSLDKELRLQNENNLINELASEKQYFNDYLFGRSKETTCKYDSLEKWEIEFRKKLQGLIFKFKSDIDLQSVNNQIKNLNESVETLDGNRYKIAADYVKIINSTIDNIKNITNDYETLSKLNQYQNIQIDYNKTAEENINEIRKKLEEVMKIEQEEIYINAPKQNADVVSENYNKKM